MGAAEGTAEMDGRCDGFLDIVGVNVVGVMVGFGDADGAMVGAGPIGAVVMLAESNMD